jgi:FtsH-binding integral membrane protein
VHAAIVLAFAALFISLFSRFFLHRWHLAESDLYENGLPIFLSPIKRWSSFEFSGLPVLADPANFDFYLPNIVLGELLRSWTAVVMSAPLLAACFTYAYVFATTRSIAAAVYSGLAYGLSEEMLERLRHINHVHAIAWLPLIVLALDRVGGPHSRRWIAIGAFAVGSCILAGHPQPAMYVMYCAGLYAVVGLLVDRNPVGGRVRGSGTGERGAGAREPAFDLEPQAWSQKPRRQRLVAIVAMFAIGILLSSIKTFPLVEARTLVVRSEGLTFQRFVGPSLSAPQLFTFVFPAILHQPITELPTYVGLATLLLALFGIVRRRSNWRITFWLAASLVGVAMALGGATPLTTAAYYVPFYSWFRNLSRHLFLFAFGFSVLAGFGMAALQAGNVSMRVIRRSAGLLAVVMVAGALLIRAFPAAFPLEGPHGEPGPGPLAIFTVGVWIQFAILAAAALALCLGKWGRRSFFEDSRRWVPLALMTILIVDLLSALPYDIKRDGIEYYALTDTQIQPSVHALAIGRALEPMQQRALAIGGTQVDDVLPATFARAWRIPIAGGYGAMLIDRVSRLAGMGTNGEVRPGVLSDADATLDVLAVKYAIVNDNLLDDPERERWLRSSPSGRWREAMHFMTSRETDRGSDEAVDGETAVTVFENERARPRVWVANVAIPMLDDSAIATIRSSRLPDGSIFDPATTVLVDPSTPLPVSHFSPGASDARVFRIGDGELGVRVSTAGGGFLVLSENAYPGWRVRIDGAEAPLYRADVTLQGVVVPPGVHRVDFSLESSSLRAGMVTSGIAALLCVGLLWL